MSGLRNRDIRLLLYPETAAAPRDIVRRASARVSRLLRILRAHGIIAKLPKSHRYRLTPKAHLLTAALFAARTATVKQLTRSAA